MPFRPQSQKIGASKTRLPAVQLRPKNGHNFGLPKNLKARVVPLERGEKISQDRPKNPQIPESRRRFSKESYTV